MIIQEWLITFASKHNTFTTIGLQSALLLSQVDEIKHCMHGLTQIHLHNKGVVYKVKFAEDVLFNEVTV